MTAMPKPIGQIAADQRYEQRQYHKPHARIRTLDVGSPEVQLRREYNRRAHSKRREWLIATKQRPCTDCGGQFHHFAMDFDHREGSKKLFAISASLAMKIPRERIIAEIAKCDLVCANRHRMRTWKRIEASRVGFRPIDPQGARTHCRKGHPYDATNTRMRYYPDGTVRGRRCVACEAQWQQDRRRTRKRPTAARCTAIAVIPGIDD